MRPTLSALVQATAVSVATILGTGILGLPVTLHTSGLRPFLVVFTLNLFAQIGIVITTVELFQRAQKNPSVNHQYQATNQVEDEESSPTELNPSPIQNQAYEAPSLHSLSKLYVKSSPLRALFNFMVDSHFLFVLAAYALAGPQAFMSLISILKKVPEWAIITAFVILLASAASYFHELLLPYLTIGTLVKSALLFILVLVVFIRGLAFRQDVADSWKPSVLVDPFLMGTFALNGIANLMPVTLQVCIDSIKGEDGTPGKVDRPFIRAYRLVSIIAVILCYVLNIMWSYAVLMCVPQTNTSTNSAMPQAGEEPAVRTLGRFLFERLITLRQQEASTSLEEANELGEISTIPLIEVLHGRNDPMVSVIAFMVNLFITLSITVSFVVMSMGLIHYIDGEARNQTTPDSRISYDVNRRSKYILAYAFILFTSLSDPTALLKIMEGFTTLSVNIECGLFMLYMLHVARKEGYDIPVALNSMQTYLIIAYVALYFVTAIVVDLGIFIPSIFTKE